MKLEIRDNAFFIDGKRSEFISGEIPYFRVPKRNWKKVMHLWKEAGETASPPIVPGWFMNRKKVFSVLTKAMALLTSAHFWKLRQSLDSA